MLKAFVDDKDERGMTVSLTDADNKYICAADYS
jgi:hypothetical protein